MAEWFFKPLDPGQTVREPVESEFFAAEAISDPGMALVREGIQNSLDAAVPGERVLVRIYLSGDGGAAPHREIERYFAGTWQHLSAERSGLKREELPASTDPCPFIVFEDFGTRGLEGDPAEPFRPRTEGKNHFYHFFRSEGQSDKEARDRGVWGVGKHVFLRSSRIRCMFGFTVRADDGARLLMGKAVLNGHYVGDHYYQDGLFGIPPQGGRLLVMPLCDDPLVDHFRTVFDVQRRTDTGLSVVVPWPDPDITGDSIIQAVLRDYFYPILAGQLEVLVETPTVKASLDARSLVAETERIGGALANELRPLLELANWGRQVHDEEKRHLRMPDPEHRWEWSKELFPEQVLVPLREAFRSGEKVAVRIPVAVREKAKPPQQSFFDVFLGRHPGWPGHPVFIREGIIIPDVGAPKTRDVRALVVVHDLPLAAFLRDAENPSHTEWQHDGSNFRDKYRSGRTDLTFVRRSVHEIVRILAASEEEEDVTLLVDFFSLPPELEEEPVTVAGQEPGKRRGKESVTTPPTPPPRVPPRFRVSRIAGGFSVLATGEPVSPDAVLDIRVAYDTRRGNPLLRYRPHDFELDTAPIALHPDPVGMQILECSGNHIRTKLASPDFSLHVTGFDENRDLYTRVVLQEGGDADRSP